MKISRATALIAVSCISLGACKFPSIPGLPGSHKAPTGQVVATVDGKEVTRMQLEAELAAVNTQDPKIRKAAEQQAVQMLVTRTILADEARRQQLDKTPDFALQQQRATDGLLVQNLQAKFANAVPAPSDEEAQRFITDHPDIFAQRKVFMVDTIRMARPSDPNLVKGLEPLKTLPDIDAYLTANHIEHAKTSGKIDAVGIDPTLVEKIMKLPPNEVFLYPGQNGVLLVNQITSTQVVPFEGDQATKYALLVLKRQRVQEAVARQMRQIVAAQAKSVRYTDAFKPAAPAGAPAAAAENAEKPAG
jgi:EpsD family peptidyl-prolyl cis-trans isomerase